MRSPENNVDKLCYAQFCKEYDPYRKRSKNKTDKDYDGDDTEGERPDDDGDNSKRGKPDDDGDDSEGGKPDDEDSRSIIKDCDRIHIPNDDSVYRLPNIIQLKNT